VFFVTYDYVESAVTQRRGFICHAENVRAAAESFWSQLSWGVVSSHQHQQCQPRFSSDRIAGGGGEPGSTRKRRASTRASPMTR
jgi:hypothetical protein